MSNRSVIPFGPQHPVLPEPIHLDLVMEDEKVVEAIPSIGFIHRGLEKLVDKKDFNEMVYVAERICGICSLGHGLGYSEAVEHIMDIEVPARARYMRTIWSELSRIHSHLLWLGLLADAFGFESLYMDCWRLREEALDMFEESTGGRVIFSVMKIGGIRRDVTNDQLKDFDNRISKMEEDLKAIARPFLEDAAVQTRLKGVGVLSAEQADALGCTGPFLRASGIVRDIRSTGYCAYGDVNFEPIVSSEGDSYARTYCRIQEIFQAFDIIHQLIAKMPEGPIEAPVKGIMAPFGMLVSKWAALKSFVDSGSVWLVLFLVFGSGSTLFYWAKWLGKICAVIHQSFELEDITPRSEMVSIFPLTTMIVVMCFAFPWMSGNMIQPILDEAYHTNIPDVIGGSDVIIMMIMVAMVFMIPIGSRFLSIGKNSKMTMSYVAGVNAGDDRHYIDSFGKERALYMSNWYMDEIFGEKKFLRPCIYVAAVLVAVMLIVVVGGAI